MLRTLISKDLQPRRGASPESGALSPSRQADYASRFTPHQSQLACPHPALYYVDATLSSTGGGVFPLGYGNGFDAIVWADRTKLNFDSIDLTGTFDPRISALGRDAAFFQVGGFMLAHEVLHSVGARHQGDVRWVMTRVPTWNWIVRWPVVSQQTVNQVKRKLDVRPR